MKVGLVAQDIDSGLAHQTWEFFRHMPVSKVLVTDITDIHAQHGKVTTRHPERFEGDAEVKVTNGLPNIGDCRWLCEGVDIVFVVETPLDWNLFAVAREMGVASVLQYNYEFLEYASTPTLPQPDLLLAPSSWYLDEAKDFCATWLPSCPVEFLPVPVATERFVPKVHERAERFIHLAGHKTYADRNGTQTVLKAMDYVKSDADFFIHSQEGGTEIENYWDLFKEGEVLLIPRRYGGLCLQLQEACAAGLVPIVGEHDPYGSMYELPSSEGEVLSLRRPIQTYDINPKDLAAKIDEMAGQDISVASKQSLAYAKQISWDTLKPKYLEKLQDVIDRTKGA